MSQPSPLQLATTLAYAKGAYTTAIRLGSAQAPANVLLDTGSSTLAVLPRAYAPEHDHDRVSGTLAQAVSYGVGAWVGPVLQSSLAFGSGRHARRLPDARFALIETPAPDWREADGILGLAYRSLDLAHDTSALLVADQVNPPLTWLWPFDTGSTEAIKAFTHTLYQQPAQTLTPVFSALEEEGIVANQFALLIRRAVVHVTEPNASSHQLAADPLNQGVLVLGGGEHSQSLYHGGFQHIRIVHDRYYNARLQTFQVGSLAPIAAPELAPADVPNYCSNAIIDTGCSFLILQHSLYEAMIEGLRQHNPALPGLIQEFSRAMASGHGLPNHRIQRPNWPELHFELEASDGSSLRLTCSPEHYWQINALAPGESWFMLTSQLPSWPNQSILGLPLWCGRYCIFDRSSGETGVVRVARAREPS